MRESQRLIRGRNMTCPRCKKQHDILQYVRLMEIEEFSKETTPIYKCPGCKWMFAPADDLVVTFLSERSSPESEVE